MGRQVKVYLDDERRKGSRKLVEATLLEERPTTIVVRLPDGNVITRKKQRDLPDAKKGVSNEAL